jgi:hypothetical protein
MSEIPEVFAIFEQKLAHVLSFTLREKGQKKAIEELLVYFSGIVERASKAESRIAELEARLESCESALTSMVYQFFYSSKSGALAHSFMSAEEEAAEYLVDYGIARWENEHKNSIVFEEVQDV